MRTTYSSFKTRINLFFISENPWEKALKKASEPEDPKALYNQISNF